MYAYLNGFLASADNQNIVIDVNGVGYNVEISDGNRTLLPPIGSPIKVYTYTCVREDAFLLYGFLEKQELDMFKKLITVNSVGPKYALNILSILSVSDIIYAIISNDVKALKKANGVGEKMAQKIILELKNKVDAEEALMRSVNSISEVDTPEVTGLSEEVSDTILALTTLGYGSSEAKKAVLSAAKDMPDANSEQLLKGALKYL